ncbi:ATP-binding protein [Caldimonas tepidiphila]|uniref:ATP-binding protein n=1 Tax=Caldimonas tepidiphila TaxID=2315841 RepID=UPI000E5C1F8B|nr:sensor histidine kinase [Caldimonas tepidiphila]
MSRLLHALPLHSETDVVLARQRAREISAALGLSGQDPVRVATTVSELARNALHHAGGGRIEFTLEEESMPPALRIDIRDEGPGIPGLPELLAGRRPDGGGGAGLGLQAAMRLMDDCRIESVPGQGTTVRLRKTLPSAPRPGEAAWSLPQAPAAAYEELSRQNRELLAALAALRERQQELARMTRELEDTNRGVVALYAELEENADRLRRADEMKSRFLSNVSHEFRTPLSSIHALTQLLLSRIDGELSPEQEHQVRLIARASADLSEMVNDLLDIAKIEAGKVALRPSVFTLADLFGALRGTLRPLRVHPHVELVFDDASMLPPLHSDEGKVSQVLRNLISNALKFTREGEVRVSARQQAGTGLVELRVADTGIGIAPDHLELIFEEFAQIENELQRHVRGTGLGLPLCRRLAALLGGRIDVESRLGSGSVFIFTLPMQLSPPAAVAAGPSEGGSA